MYTSNQIFTLGIFTGILLMAAGIVVVVIYDRIRANRFDAHTNQMLNLVGEYGLSPLNEDLGYLLYLAEQENEQLQAKIADLKEYFEEADAEVDALIEDNERLEASVKRYQTKLLSYASELNAVLQSRNELAEQVKAEPARTEGG